MTKNKDTKKQFLTDFWPLRDRRDERAIREFGRIVIDVLHFNNELRLWFQGLVGVQINGLSMKYIMRLFLTVQTLGGMDISGYLIDNKDSSCSFST